MIANAVSMSETTKCLPVCRQREMTIAFQTVLDQYRRILAFPRERNRLIGELNGTPIVKLELPLCKASRCRDCPLGPMTVGCARDELGRTFFGPHPTEEQLARRYFALRARAAAIGLVVHPEISREAGE
jgi:hypothetical protein